MDNQNFILHPTNSMNVREKFEHMTKSQDSNETEDCPVVDGNAPKARVQYCDMSHAEEKARPKRVCVSKREQRTSQDSDAVEHGEDISEEGNMCETGLGDDVGDKDYNRTDD